MLTIADVPKWLRLRGIDHILMSAGRWNYTACGTMTNDGTVRKRPGRKCRRCVAMLSSLVKIDDKQNQAPWSEQ